MKSPQALAVRYRSQRLKLTPQRQLIFSLLHNNHSHPTAESLYAMASAQMPGISLRTVYQTLNELARMGELRLVDLGKGATRYDPNVEDHHHAICNHCGRICDVAVKATSTIKPLCAPDFTVQDVGVVFRGLCADCNSRPKKSTKNMVAKKHQQRKREKTWPN